MLERTTKPTLGTMSVFVFLYPSLSLHKTTTVMKQFIKVREHYHVHEPASEVAYRENTMRNEFRRWWIDEMALTLALMIPGADPIAVTAHNSAFYKAAKEIYYYMLEDFTHQYWNIQSQPLYTDSSIGIVYIRQDNHQPEIKYYKTT